MPDFLGKWDYLGKVAILLFVVLYKEFYLSPL